MILVHDQHRKELAGGFRHTTNNRMEIMAALVGLRALKTPCVVTLYSDSQYLVESMTLGWVQQWKARGWHRGKEAKPIPNADLWRDLLDAAMSHEISFEWVKGHVGHRENERCDRLAVRAASQTQLPPDEGFEKAHSGAQAQPSLFEND